MCFYKRTVFTACNHWSWSMLASSCGQEYCTTKQSHGLKTLRVHAKCVVCRRHDLERAGLHVRNGINANLSDDKEILEVISGNLMGAVELDAGRDGVGFVSEFEGSQVSMQSQGKEPTATTQHVASSEQISLTSTSPVKALDASPGTLSLRPAKSLRRAASSTPVRAKSGRAMKKVMALPDYEMLEYESEDEFADEDELDAGSPMLPKSVCGVVGAAW